MKEEKSIKMQVSVKAAIYEKFKIIVADMGQTIPIIIENLLQDFVEKYEEEWLNSLILKQLEKANRGEKIINTTHIEELLKIAKKNKNQKTVLEEASKDS